MLRLFVGWAFANSFSLRWGFSLRQGYGLTSRPDKKLQCSATRQMELLLYRESMAVGDPALGKIVGGEFNRHGISAQNPDEKLPQATGGMCNDLMTVFQFNSKETVGKVLNHLSSDFYAFFRIHDTASRVPIKRAGFYRSEIPL